MHLYSKSLSPQAKSSSLLTLELFAASSPGIKKVILSQSCLGPEDNHLVANLLGLGASFRQDSLAIE